MIGIIKFKVGDRVKILKAALNESLIGKTLTIAHIFYGYGESPNLYAVKGDIVISGRDCIACELFVSSELQAVPEPSIPIHEIANILHSIEAKLQPYAAYHRDNYFLAEIRDRLNVLCDEYRGENK